MKTVEECYKTISTGVDIVEPKDSIKDVVRVISRDPSSRSVFVVDKKKGLVGIIRVREILNYFGSRYIRNHGLASPGNIMAKKASHLMGPPYHVSPDDTIEDALRLAVQSELYDIPVVEEGKVIGNLDCLEIIMNYSYKSY